MDSQSPDSAPTALADLVAAGLVSHEMIGDPARLGPEAEVLRVLCGLVAGPIWRIEPFHYAFRAGAGPEDPTPGRRRRPRRRSRRRSAPSSAPRRSG